MMDISTLIGASAPLTETNLKGAGPTAENSEVGDFNHLLEAILSEVELSDQEAGDITQSTTWLGTLLHVFSQHSFGSTPDSSGEASTSAETGLSVSLTELMTALQTVPSQEDTPELASLAPEDLGFFIEPETNMAIEEVLTIVRNESDETIDWTALSSLQSLLTGSPSANSTGTGQATTTAQATAGTGQAATTAQTTAGSTPQTLAGFVELAADQLPTNSPKAANTAQSAVPAPGNLPLTESPVEATFDAVLEKTETLPQTAGQAKAEPTPVSPPADNQLTDAAFRSAVEAANEVPFRPQPEVQARPEGVTPVNQPVATATTPLTVVAESKAAAGPTLPNVPALQQIVDTVELITSRGETSVRLQLHPESLGRVTIQLHTTNGDVAMRVLTETAQAQTLIRDHLPELKAAFATQGLQLNNLTVDVGSDTSTFDQPGQGSEGRLFEWADEYNRGPLKETPGSADPVRPHWTPGRGLNSINYQV